MKKLVAARNLKLAKETLLTLGRVAPVKGGYVAPTVPVTVTIQTFNTCRLCEDTWLTV